MALITCTECGASVSDKAAACTQCGAPLQEATVTLHRKKAFGGSAMTWHVTVDGIQVGSLRSGQSITVSRPSGFTVGVGGAMGPAAGETAIRVSDKQDLEFLLSLGALGIKAKQLR